MPALSLLFSPRSLVAEQMPFGSVGSFVAPVCVLSLVGAVWASPCSCLACPSSLWSRPVVALASPGPSFPGFVLVSFFFACVSYLQSKFSSRASCTRFLSNNWRPTCRIKAKERLCRISRPRFVFSHPCKSAVAFWMTCANNRTVDGPAFPKVPKPMGRKPQPHCTNLACFPPFCGGAMPTRFVHCQWVLC